MTGNREQAEDLFQETFKRVHEKAHTFRGLGFKNWLFRIATNAAIDGLRRQKRLRVVSLNQSVGCCDENCDELGAVTAADCCDASDEAIRAEQKEQVREAVDELPTKQRATLVLAVQEGSPAEKAGIRAGDRILKIDGKSPDDPMRLPELVPNEAGKTIVLVTHEQTLARAASRIVQVRDGRIIREQ
jgi:RNA polymerase sigma factor (sigma-70 family)